MPRVTFYLLQQQSTRAVRDFACRLTDKAWRSGMPVHIHTDNAIQCETMDRLLWEWREERFLPHEITHSEIKNGESNAPITLGHTDPGNIEGALLINLSSGIPDFYKNFHRTCEIVDKSPGPVEALRQKFRDYKNDGIKPELHDIAAGGQH
ncbi:DNA polymerase III subunit chi [Endozoicomonas lisbonensis]|uniref:DNA polymerase-3 subunit chi n=1 Tax=Endozoicomonas lisbonensis TaxID=3120522 RepID=A0ABV2SM17_9GAMM